MGKVNHYELEGRTVEVPLRQDVASEREIEDYGPFLELSPIYTPEGRPILLSLEDACPFADMPDNGPKRVDCGSCACFRQLPGSLLGVCHNERMRSGLEKQASGDKFSDSARVLE